MTTTALQITEGTRVSFENIANPIRYGTVIEIRPRTTKLVGGTAAGIEIPQMPHVVLWDDEGQTTADVTCGNGWTVERIEQAAPTEGGAVGIVSYFTARYAGEQIFCEGDAMGWSAVDEESKAVLLAHGQRAQMRCKAAWEKAFEAACVAKGAAERDERERWSR